MSKPPITHLIIDTWSTNDDYNGDCDYALVPMTADYVADLLWYTEEVRQLYKVDDSIYALECWDGTPSYFRFNEKLETLKDFRGKLAVKVPKGVPILLTAEPGIQGGRLSAGRLLHGPGGQERGLVVGLRQAHQRPHHDCPGFQRDPAEDPGSVHEGRRCFPAEETSTCASCRAQIHDLLYLDMKNERFYYDAEKEWNTDTLDQIAKIVAQYIPRPPSVKSDER